MARLAFNKQLEAKETTAAEGKGKDVADGDDASVKHIKERLADTHSLLSEISLENERFVALHTCSVYSKRFADKATDSQKPSLTSASPCATRSSCTPRTRG